MNQSEANVLSSPDGFQPRGTRASARQSSSFTLAAWRTGGESSAWFPSAHIATLTAMGRSIPVRASLSQLNAQRLTTRMSRRSLRLARAAAVAPRSSLGLRTRTGIAAPANERLTLKFRFGEARNETGC
jgi:hypothetical protein